ncbi:hypothetical protein [Methylobacterium dankookense]|uniref:Uncharacterized protein n=2 Tax=Methylobacteriaceae TaxID=119045 RepID=A0A564G6E6_9HYPH|nr:hypothetical protein [Methylobacterium dankookense]GJD58778.1 hypothetical protein IFDJLNFL_4701 [Methylobacterium dankookense]VUF15518.1 hypothetical protein MTDSW087_05260 [Methylobacterium dankookense]
MPLTPRQSYAVPPVPSVLMDRADVETLLREQEERTALQAKLAHLRVLHAPRARGNATVIVDSRFDEGVHLRTRELAKDPAAHAASHVSLQRHYESRGAHALARVNALMWADCEISSGSPFHGMPPQEISGILMSRMDAAGIPRPSYILFSGRGLWCVWLSRRPLKTCVQVRVRRLIRCLWGEAVQTGAANVERVKAKAAANAAIWQGMDLDWSVGDMARVHRVAGSINEKSEERVRLLWPESWGDVQRHDLDTLADAVMPFSRSETARYREERDARRAAREAQAAAEGKPVAPPRLRTHSRGLWGAVEAELLRVLAIGPDRLARLGLRDLLCFHVAVARARTSMGGDADSWARELAPLVIGDRLTEENLRSYLGAVAKRLRQHEAGEVRMHKGRAVTPLYTPKLAKIRADLNLPADLCDELGLTLLRPDAPVRTATERSAARRQREGATPRADHAHTLAEVARLAREIQGATDLPLTEIARLLDCSRATVYRALDAHPAEAVVKIIPSEETVTDGVSVPARNLKGGYASPACPAPPKIPGPAAPAAKAPEARTSRRKSKAAPQPQTLAWPPYDPIQRLLALYEFGRARTLEAEREHGQRQGWCSPWDDMMCAASTLQFEMEEGRMYHSAPLKPRNEAKLRARLAVLGIDPYLYLPCPSPDTCLH